MLRRGDKVKFEMIRMPNGCLAPHSEDLPKDSRFETVEGEIIHVDEDIITIRYLCEKCQRYYETAIISTHPRDKHE
jgi:hypothetical protein